MCVSKEAPHNSRPISGAEKLSREPSLTALLPRVIWSSAKKQHNCQGLNNREKSFPSHCDSTLISFLGRNTDNEAHKLLLLQVYLSSRQKQ